MQAEQLLDEHNVDTSLSDIDDTHVLEMFEDKLQRWWVETFGEYVPENGGFFTPPQKQAIPNIKEEKNTLIASPTGSGKTQASFSSVIDSLVQRAEECELENSVYCLYVSPLKSLANDIHKNLEKPLSEIQDEYDDLQEIRQAIRHGDTPSEERQRMLRETPHILNTTPETLAILLTSPKFREKLRTVEWVIVDEIHSLADNKRGTHLSVSLERLENLTHNTPTRIGCSATVEPLDTVAQFLVGMDDTGAHRDYEIVDTRFVRDVDLRVECPVADLIGVDSGFVQDRFYERMDELIQEASSAIVFTNTRSGAERILHKLQQRFDKYNEDNAACHHGSLDKETRKFVEKQLKLGGLDVVTTSTSLELGIDMQDVDLVIQVGSPKTIAGLLQRVGRAGHQLGETVRGRVLVLDRDELVECTVMAKKAVEGYIDRVHVPERAQDVATQHVYGMAISDIRPRAEVFDTLKRAYPYRNHSEEDFEDLLRYMEANYEGLEEKNVYPKIWVDTNDEPDGEHHYDEFDVGTELIGKRGSTAQMIYMQNIGTIPTSFSCDVYTGKSNSENNWVGTLDEEYLDALDKGDVFVLGGRNLKYRYRRGGNVYVNPTSESPTVPSWFSERLPLSYDLGTEILEFQQEVAEQLDTSGPVRNWLGDFPIDTNSVEALLALYTQQVAYTGWDSISTPRRLSVEEHVIEDEYERRYYIHSVYGRKFNDGLSRVLANECSKQTNKNVQLAVSDQGVMLKMPRNADVDVKQILSQFESEEEVRNSLREGIRDTDLLNRYFRINATRSLMILENYKGQKSGRLQQHLSDMLLSFAEELPDFIVVEETYRELLEDKLDVGHLGDILTQINHGEITVSGTSVETPSPRAFGLAKLSASDVVMADEESSLLREFQENVLSEVSETEIDYYTIENND